jgi:hypothetical protein
MPKYSRGGSKKRFVTKKTKQRAFKHPYDLLHYLSQPEEKLKPMRDLAQKYLDGSEIPPIKLNKDGLAKLVHSESHDLVRQAARDLHTGKLGGGIASGAAVIGQEISHLIGWDHVVNPNHGRKQDFDSEVAAYLTDLTYKPPGERPERAMTYTRLPEFDNEFCSVWQKRDGSLLLTCRGTKMSFRDLKEDMNVLFGGKTVDDADLVATMQKLKEQFPGEKYDVAGHSLGSYMLMQEASAYRDQWDDTYLFNAPSSPLQSDGWIRDVTNNYNLTFFQNYGDPISTNTTHFMDSETLDENLVNGSYQYSPVAAHSITNWYPSSFVGSTENIVDNPINPPSSGAELQQDSSETQAAGLS